MKNFKMVISKSTDPFFNTETDEYMLKLAGGGAIPPVIRFYKNSDSVILGRFQCPELEADEEFCAENGIPIIKRISGGGAVFHDLGNLNTAVYIPENLMPAKYVSECMQIFSNAIRNALLKVGFPAETDTHNSVFVNGKKVSGSAGAKKFGGFLFHATLLLNADTEKMKKALNPKKTYEQVKKRCVKSNRSEIINLYEIKFVREETLINLISEEIDCTINSF
ncbi:MAG: lipoate--protein ligase family protein [Caldisericaceae bacterium]|nr:lipoate--protein ligase family protein [Caldisericaceae bacterium]